MRALSNLLFVLAAGVAGFAILVFGALRNTACGYAPNSSGCRAVWPSEMASDDRLLLVELPLGLVLMLLAGAVILRRKSR
jgi:hypothetical protein